MEDIILDGRKCIIFSNWEKVTSQIKERLLKYKPAYVAGTEINDANDLEKTEVNVSINSKIKFALILSLLITSLVVFKYSLDCCNSATTRSIDIDPCAFEFESSELLLTTTGIKITC